MTLCGFRKGLVFGIFVLILIPPFTTAVDMKILNVSKFDDLTKEKPDALVNVGLMDSSWDIYHNNKVIIGFSQNNFISNSVDGEWIKTFGGTENDIGRSVQQTLDGGYILTGYTRSYGAEEADVWLIKLDAGGNEQWNKTFGGAESDSGYSVQQTMDGGYIITGYTTYGFDYDLLLIKTDSNGNEYWNKTFGGRKYDKGESVQQTSDGGYIIAGWTESYGAGKYDFWLIKTDANGNEQWNTTIGTKIFDIGHSVNQTDDGGYIIVGETYHPDSIPYDAWLIKLDTGGNEQWNKTFGGEDDDYGYSVQQTTDGGYVFAGYTKSYSISVWADVWLVKTDANGNEVWNRTYGGNSGDLGYSMQQTTDEGYIIEGITSSYGAGELDVWLIKTDSDGYKLWDKTFGGPKDDRGESVQQTTDGGYIITGFSDSYGAGRDDVLVIKASSFFNRRPSAPMITGPTKIKKYDNIKLTLVSTDPDGDDLYYYIDWGKYDKKEWFGPYNTSESIEVSHYFPWEGVGSGTITIRSKVEDIHGGESEWATFKVTIPRIRACLRFFDMFPNIFPLIRHIQ